MNTYMDYIEVDSEQNTETVNSQLDGKTILTRKLDALLCEFYNLWNNKLILLNTIIKRLTDILEKEFKIELELHQNNRIICNRNKEKENDYDVNDYDLIYFRLLPKDLSGLQKHIELLIILSNERDLLNRKKLFEFSAYSFDIGFLNDLFNKTNIFFSKFQIIGNTYQYSNESLLKLMLPTLQDEIQSHSINKDITYIFREVETVW